MSVLALIEMICRVLSLRTRMKAPRGSAHSIVTAVAACAAGGGCFGFAPDGGSRDFPFPRRLRHFEAAKRGGGRPPWWNGHLRGSFR